MLAYVDGIQDRSRNTFECACFRECVMRLTLLIVLCVCVVWHWLHRELVICLHT